MQSQNLVLIIDDDIDDIEILTDCIHKVDENIICCGLTNPNQVLARLTQPFPDYIFLDVRMPQILGDEILKQIRDIKEFDNSVIIIMSATINAELSDRLKSYGANHVFQKTGDVDELLHILQGILKPQ